MELVDAAFSVVVLFGGAAMLLGTATLAVLVVARASAGSGGRPPWSSDGSAAVETFATPIAGRAVRVVRERGWVHARIRWRHTVSVAVPELAGVRVEALARPADEGDDLVGDPAFDRAFHVELEPDGAGVGWLDARLRRRLLGSGRRLADGAVTLERITWTPASPWTEAERRALVALVDEIAAGGPRDRLHRLAGSDPVAAVRLRALSALRGSPVPELPPPRGPLDELGRAILAGAGAPAAPRAVEGAVDHELPAVFAALAHDPVAVAVALDALSRRVPTVGSWTAVTRIAATVRTPEVLAALSRAATTSRGDRQGLRDDAALQALLAWPPADPAAQQVVRDLGARVPTRAKAVSDWLGGP